MLLKTPIFTRIFSVFQTRIPNQTKLNFELLIDWVKTFKKAKQLNSLVRCAFGIVYSNRLGLETFDHLQSLPSLLPFLRPLLFLLPFSPALCLPRLPCRPTGCRLGLGQGHSPPQQSFMENASFWSRLHQALTLYIFPILIRFSQTDSYLLKQNWLLMINQSHRLLCWDFQNVSLKKTLTLGSIPQVASIWHPCIQNRFCVHGIVCYLDSHILRLLYWVSSDRSRRLRQMKCCFVDEMQREI